MAKATITKDKDGNDQVEQVNQPEGATTMETGTPVPREVMAHIWQKDSPALNTNILGAAGASAPSILNQIDTEENLKKREKQAAPRAKVTKGEYVRRTKLDVSDPQYINPSLDHHEITDGTEPEMTVDDEYDAIQQRAKPDETAE